jgi:arabinofuranosyltransferase
MTRLDRTWCARALVVAAACAAVVWGWREMWFLTDDAFIAFRYVGNSYLGHGYVWNPPPFRPVEGYTSFLWIVLLDLTWRVTGFEPPSAANWIALAFTLASTLLAAAMVLAMPLGERLARHRTLLLALVLAAVATNRTFLTWSSSGLETAMCNFWILAWLAASLRYSKRRDVRSGAGVAALAAAIALTRPEGLLFACASVAMVGAAWLARRGAVHSTRDALLSLAPLAAVALHVLWRRSFYGEWLPNTYYAKYVGAWPEAGAMYLASYALEHALWFPAALFLAAAPRLATRRIRGFRASIARAGWVRGAVEDGWIRDMAVAAVLASLAYYTFAVGGDTFEYRVYSHAVPMVAVGVLWLVDRAGWSARASLASLAATVVLAWPIAWLHHDLARGASEEAAVADEQVLVAPHLPAAVRWYGELFDRWQRWLFDRLICGRHHCHRALVDQLARTYPPRGESVSLQHDDIPVLALEAVGVAGWRLPQVAILDLHGLNDYFVARMPPPRAPRRQMAHDRFADPEYVRALAPNVRVTVNEPYVHVQRREKRPLTAERLEAIERRWFERVHAR